MKDDIIKVTSCGIRDEICLRETESFHVNEFIQSGICLFIQMNTFVLTP